MELIKKMTKEEVVEWFKNNKPEFIKIKEAKEQAKQNESNTTTGINESNSQEHKEGINS